MRFKRLKLIILAITVCATIYLLFEMNALSPVIMKLLEDKESNDIKWVDFDITYDAMKAAMNADIESYEQETHVNWVDTLAYLGARYGGNFSSYKAKDLNEFVEKVKNGEEVSDITADMKYFDYYRRAYGAVLNGFLGEYTLDGNTLYGLKAFCPIADGYWYNDYDDFGAGRTYGYNRKHFGHDLMISTGTPIIAIESGTVEIMGWNQYGGWRIGIRSFDGQRYYYYAHLRKDHPYNDRLSEGKVVMAGDVIGYSGQTGYSIKENVNNIDTPHLHVGIQLIFDEDKKDDPNQIWVDMYALTRLLSSHKSEVAKKEKSDGSTEYYSIHTFTEENYYGSSYLKESAEKLIKSNIFLENIVLSDTRLSSVKPSDDSTNASDGDTGGAGTDKAVSSMNIVSSSGSPESISVSEEDSICVPIIMYHGLIKDRKLQTAYFIHPDKFEQDLKYLKDHGYTTILMADLINYVENGIALPQNPVVLTFDDGYYNNYYYAYPLLQKYDMKAVISIIGSFTDRFSLVKESSVSYSHITWVMINDMIASGNIEIQNHSYDLHSYNKGRKGVMKKSSESGDQYTAFLKADVGKLQQRISDMTGKSPDVFAYPYGFFSAESDNILRDMGFKSTLGCTEGLNYITRDTDCLFKLKRYLRDTNTSVEYILNNHK